MSSDDLERGIDVLVFIAHALRRESQVYFNALKNIIINRAMNQSDVSLGIMERNPHWIMPCLSFVLG